jgi:DNA-binding transcriptional MocR family regulator
MLKQGWIKLYRKVQDNPLDRKPNYKAVWEYLLLNANPTNTEFIWNNKRTVINRGSLLTSIKSIADYYGLSTGTVSYIIDYLISENMIEKQSNFSFTVITVKNWTRYQGVESKVESELKASKKRVESELKHSKKDKKDKNTKRDISENDYQELAKYFLIDVSQVKRVYEDIIDWESAKKGGEHYKDMKAALRNWIRRRVDEGKLKQGDVIRPWN